MQRLLLVSNRLPVTLGAEHGEVVVRPSTGGLVTALRSVHDRQEGRWIGWTGGAPPASAVERRAVDARLAELRAVPVYLDATEVREYYDRFSNGVLWPLFHYLLDRVNIGDHRAWEAYEAINRRFANVVLEQYRPGDVIWIHDYQLMLVPGMLRETLSTAKIGFFLHIPFPAFEIFRTLPRRESILRGLLGADQVGLHASTYRDAFLQSAASLLGASVTADSVVHAGRRVAIGVHPIGVDTAELGRLAGCPEVRAEMAKIRARTAGSRLVLGVDRLDYTKGLPQRLAAIERLLDRDPALARGLRFVQLAIPTREAAQGYAQIRKEVNELVGRINGRFGSVGAMPIHFLYRTAPAPELAALYAAADVMLVTALRDGMNLVAKEYVATRTDEAGALVLSEFAGAAAELPEALLVNPYDVDGVAAGIARAATMPAEEQRRRMRALRRTIIERDVHAWARGFLDGLESEPTRVALKAAAPTGPPSREATERARNAPHLVLILDYDGTLVPIAARPELAVPDSDLWSLLTALAARPETRVHIASGRRREELSQWLGDLPVDLHAEHGLSFRPRGGTWSAAAPTCDWKGSVRAILEEATRRAPGSFIEEKKVTLAWHYRAVDAEIATAGLREIEARIEEVRRARDLDAMHGSKVLEVKPRWLSKSLVVARALAHAPAGAVVIAIGDDTTDEDLFAALPPSALSIHVGEGPSRAAYRVASSHETRGFLRSLLEVQRERARSA